MAHAGDTAYAAEGVKRRKTELERAAEVAVDPHAPWTVSQRQPWADKTVQPARPTPEQIAWLEQEGFIKDEEEKDKEVSDGVSTY